MNQRAVIRPQYDSFNPAQLRETVSSGSYEIRFFHPGYPWHRALLLRLPACDHPEGGLHHETARIACAIVAGNRWDGFLSESTDAQPIALSPHELLRRDEYYFHLPPTPSSSEAGSTLAENPYPVVPSFEHWSFPYENLPTIWQGLELPPASLDDESILFKRDPSCRLTNEKPITEAAYLCPKSQERWFMRNGLSDYQSTTSQGADEGVDHISNTFRLRQDLHTAFNMNNSVFVPKHDTDGTIKLVIHLLLPCAQYAAMFQNVQLQDMRVSKGALFARFAWAIFNVSTPDFLISGIPRALIVNGAKHGKVFSAEECQHLAANLKPERDILEGSSSNSEDIDRNDYQIALKRRRQTDSENESDYGASDAEDELRRMEELSRGRSAMRFT